MENVVVRNVQSTSLKDFLLGNEFFVEQITDSVLQVTRSGEAPVFINDNGLSLYFSVDLGSMKEMDSKELYFALLDLNTEILPVSVGIDTTEKDDPRLVLVESRETASLDQNELLSVFDAFEIAVDKVEETIAPFIN